MRLNARVSLVRSRGRARMVWVGLPALMAPVGLAAGWTIAPIAQGSYLSSLIVPISNLAALGMPHRTIMTVGFVVSGAALIASAATMPIARAEGRLALGVSGLAVLGVAAAPLPTYGQVHSLAALVAFTALTFWPVFAAPREPTGTLLDRSPAKRTCAVGATLLVVLYVVPTSAELWGVLERAFSAGLTIWVCAAALSAVSARDRW